MSKQHSSIFVILKKLLISIPINTLLCIITLFFMYEMNFSEGIKFFVLTELIMLVYVAAMVLHYFIYKKNNSNSKKINTLYLLVNFIFMNPIIMADTVLHLFT